MSETPFFFDGQGRRLFGLLHQPDTVRADAEGWVFCHPFAEEKLWSHRVFVSMARELAREGMPVLRFDYRGYGDSEGDFEQFTPADHVADIHAAAAELRRRLPTVTRVNLLGLRYGASLAVLAAAGDPAVGRLVLWDPIVDMAQYLQDQLRSNLTTQMVLYGKVVTNRDELVARIRAGEFVNIDGYGLGNPFFDQACAIRLPEVAAQVQAPVRIVEIARASQAPRADLQALAAAFPDADLQRVEELQFWKEIKQFVRHSPALSAATRTWLEAAHA